MSYIFVNFPGPFRQKGGDSNKNSRQFLQSRNKRLTIHIISKEEGLFFSFFHNVFDEFHPSLYDLIILN